jgi:hypothetical protein
MWPFRRKRSPAPLVIAGEEDFLDLTFTIIDTVRRDDGATFTAAAMHEGTRVGLIAEIVARKAPGTPLEGTDYVIQHATVTLRRSGEDSDALIGLLARRFGVTVPGNRMVDALPLTSVSLEGHPARIAKEPARLKLFFEHSEYDFECYLNVDPGAGTLALAEKDSDYRPAIVRALLGATHASS